MKQTNITAFLVALLVIMTQSAGAWSAVGVGRDDDHESGFIRIGVCLSESELLASVASELVEGCVAADGDFQADEITTDELYFDTCVGVFIGSSTDMHQEVYIRTDSDADTASSMAQTACEQDHTTCFKVESFPPGSFASGCDRGQNWLPDTTQLITTPGAMAPVTAPQVSMTSPTANTATSSSSSSGTGLAIAGGVVAIGLVYWIFGSNAEPYFTPQASFAYDNGVNAHVFGGRWDYNAENWHGYHQFAHESNYIGDDLIAGAGVKWDNDNLVAAFDSIVRGGKSDMDLSLSAKQNYGALSLNGGYQFGVSLSDTETDTQNRLNLNADYTVNKWSLSANANTDGDNSAARIGYSYRF